MSFAVSGKHRGKMMDKLEVLYDHYKESFTLSKEAQSRRNKSFVILCILEAVSFLILIKPEEVFELINAGIRQEVDTALVIGSAVLQTLIWIMIAYVMIRYVQDVLYVERQYDYLGRLEKEISEAASVRAFDREGENYSRQYPMVLNFVDLFYKMLMPIFFASINTIHIIREWRRTSDISLAIVCDTVLYVACFVIVWFYFFEIHPKITGFAKRYIPFVSKIAEMLRRLLKEV